MVFSNNLLLGAVSAAADAYLIEQSLLFDGTAYFDRTPSTAGNRKTWTFSCWLKRGELGVSDSVFSAGDGGSNYSRINFQADNTLIIVAYTGASAVYNYQTSAVFTDTSAWYHIVVQQDVAAGAVALWVNGVSVALNELTQKSINYDGYINSTFAHSVGRLSTIAAIYSGLMALPILVDGAALAPTAFGETDDNGFWNPIEFAGAITTNNVSVGGTASAETTFLTYVPANAFDGNTSTRWISSATPSWLEYDRGSGNGVISTSYSISCGPSGSASTADMPKNWTIEGYNGSSWDTLATVTNEAAWSLGETRLYTFTNTTSYEKYRIDITLQQGGGSEIEVGELRFYAVGTGFGTNGGAYDFADTTFFGKNVSGTDDQAALSSAAPAATAWLNITSAWTMGSGTASRTTTVNAIRSASVFTGDFSLALTMASGATAARLGVYAANEDSTFVSSGADSAGMDSMTNSFYANFGAGSFYKGSSTTASVSQTNGAITITRVSGTITINTAGGNHTFAATYTGPMRFVLAGGGATMSFTGITYTSDGQAGNSYFDNNFTASDQLADTPTNSADDGIGNFTAFDPNRADTQAAVYSEGNRLITSSGDGSGFMPMGMSSGKWYWEVTVTTFGGNYVYVGIGDSDAALSTNAGAAAGCWQYHSDGYESSDGVASGGAWGASYGLNAVIGVAYDADNGFLYLAKDNTFQASGDPTSGATGTGALAGGLNSAEKFPIVRVQNNTNAASVNMGQTAFTYTPPSEYVALATQNLPVDAPLYTGTVAQYRVGAPIINPFTDLPNAIHGWRADLGLSLTGSSVDQWDDQIGSWNLVDGGTKPTVLSSNINGLDAISFPGDGGNLSVSGVTLTMPYTMLMVMKQITWMLYGYPFGVFTQKGLQQRSSTPQLTQGDNLANTNSAATVGSYFPIMAEFGNTTSDFLQIGDTKVEGTASGNSSISSSTFMLGAAQSSPPSNRSANVAYAEFIIVEGAISEFDLANYRAYVKDRYGV